MRRLLISVVCAILMAFLAVGTAHAHSGLDTATPAPGGSLPAGVDHVEMDFKGSLSPSKPQRVDVLDARNKSQLAGKPTVTGNRLTFPIQPLEAGLHKVRYAVTFDDGHVATGSYYFSVLPRPDDGSWFGTTLLVAGGVVVAVLVPLAVWVLRRRSRKRGRREAERSTVDTMAGS